MKLSRHRQLDCTEPLKCAMQSVNLICNPATPCSDAHRIGARVGALATHALEIQFALNGDIGRLRIPPECAPRRVDRLWQHSCFEAFVAAPGDERYWEFNFAPSGEWAIYRFDSYRQGMTAIEATAPIVTTTRSANNLVVNVFVDLNVFSDLKNCAKLRLALSAVIEDSDGGLSYWALAHPPGKPDFHHADSFALTLNRLSSPE